MTTAGKPVYSLHGDIYVLSPIFATLYAIISKIEAFKFCQDTRDLEFFGTDTLKVADRESKFAKASVPESGNILKANTSIDYS
jgi:hypothetical protein